MERTLVIQASKDTKYAMFNDFVNGGRSVSRAIYEDGFLKLDCDIVESHTFGFCSLDIPIDQTHFEEVDLSSYSRLEIELAYQSDYNDTLLIYLDNQERNQHGEYSRANLNVVKPQQGMKLYQLYLDEFYVPSWWFLSHAQTAYAKTKFDNISSIRLASGDNDRARHVQISFRRVKFTGKLIDETSLYLTIILIWLFIGCVETVRYVILVQKNFAKTRKFARRLSEVNQMLLDEKDKLEDQANHDELTNCLNRHGLNGVLGKLNDVLMNENEPASVIVLDIDFFKKINDKYGHDEGDRVLIKVSRILLQSVRRSDHVVRWGGEEFVVLCMQASVSDAERLAEKLRCLIASSELLTGQPAVSCSFGVAQLSKGNFVEGFTKADAALYQAKQQGRNRVIVAE
ncbi:GGDEF domain-containing protein [Catenovulum sp. SX2]|uniref:GGDEF domain-containing protein n=1 Tax=Catenovulum sp. SX2 TaxID=3398614 RepID=UPI003F83461D